MPALPPSLARSGCKMGVLATASLLHQLLRAGELIEAGSMLAVVKHETFRMQISEQQFPLPWHLPGTVGKFQSEPGCRPVSQLLLHASPRNALAQRQHGDLGQLEGMQGWLKRSE